MKMNKLTVVVSVALASAGFNVSAGSNLGDARSVAMGGTGVASADYLTSSFHNPALGAVYRLDGDSSGDDDFGILIPSIGAQLNDPDDMITSVDDAVDTFDKYADGFDKGTASASQSSELNSILDNLDNKDPVILNAGAGIAVAIPTKYVSVNVFVGGYADVVAIADIADEGANFDPNNPFDVKDRFEDSEVGIAGVIETEIGIAFSKQFKINEEKFAFGISPKIQQFESYASFSTLRDFEIDDFDENKKTDSGINFDLGAAWIHGNWRAGMVVKDVVSKDVKTVDDDITYKVAPKVTVGGAFVSDYFVASVDADLTKEERFTNIKDDTQFIRFGLEGNAWGWAQLRAGYAYDIEDNVEDSFSAGIGISPFDVVSFDVAGTYASDSSLGASANLAFTF